jgi:hypothetical protein
MSDIAYLPFPCSCPFQCTDSPFLCVHLIGGRSPEGVKEGREQKYVVFLSHRIDGSKRPQEKI